MDHIRLTTERHRSLFLVAAIALWAIMPRVAWAHIRFGPPAIYAPNALGLAITLGDLSHNGRLDLVVPENAGGTVGVLMGRPDGTFANAVAYPAGLPLGVASGVAVGDFNGDGTLDVAVTPFCLHACAGSVSVLLGKGDGTFGAPISSPAGIAPGVLAVGDFNGDGREDLAVLPVGGLGPDNTVSILLSNGDGTFRPPVTYFVGDRPTEAAVADLNGDGRPDLAVAYGSTDVQNPGGVRVLLNNGDGTFHSGGSYATGCSPSSVAIGDLNKDGRPDLVVANSNSDGCGGGVSVLLGNGDGSFRKAVNWPVGVFPQSIQIADFDGDGNPDLAVADECGNTNLLWVMPGRGDGTFGPPRSFPLGNGRELKPFQVVVGDFNGDGKPDVAVANDVGQDVSVLLNESIRPYEPGSGDLTGHGDVTVADATLALRIAIGARAPTPEQVAAGDLNGDGKVDVGDALLILRRALGL